MTRRLSHVVGFDDAPFEPVHRGDVMIVGAVYAGPRLDGVLSARVRRDGTNATRVIAELVQACRFRPQLHAILLQGIAFAGFNVVDLQGLNTALGIPVLAVVRHRPDLAAVRCALLEHVRGGARKWRLIEQAGTPEPIGRLHVQRAGLTLDEARMLIASHGRASALPEPLRTAHLIAGGVTLGESTGRA